MKQFLLAGLLVLSSAVFAYADGPTVVKSKDNQIEITLPDGWASTELKSNVGKIQAKCAEKNAYVVVVSEDKGDFNHKSIAEYAAAILKIEQKNSKLTDRKVGELKPLKVNGHDALECQETGTMGTVKIVYCKTFVDTGGRWNQVMCWTMPSHLKESQADFNAIRDSIKEP